MTDDIIETAQEIGERLGIESYIRTVHRNSKEIEVCYWNEEIAVRNRLDYEDELPIKNGITNLKEFVITDEKSRIVQDSVNQISADKLRILNELSIEWDISLEAIEGFMINDVNPVQKLITQTDPKIYQEESEISTTERLEKITDIVCMSPTTSEELCKKWNVSFEKIVNQLHELQDFYSRNDDKRIVPSERAEQISETLMRILIFSRCGIDIGTQIWDEISDKNLNLMLERLEDYGYIQNLDSEREKVEKILQDSRKYHNIISHFTAENMHKNSNPITQSPDDRLLLRLKSNYGQYKLSNITENELIYTNGNSESIRIRIRDNSKIIHSGEVVGSSSDLNDFHEYLREIVAQESREELENRGMLVLSEEGNYSFERNYQYEKDMDRIKKYIAGWIESSADLDFELVNESKFTKIELSSYLRFCSENQIELLDKISKDLEFEFTVQDDYIKIEKTNHLINILEWVEEYLILYDSFLENIRESVTKNLIHKRDSGRRFICTVYREEEFLEKNIYPYTGGHYKEKNYEHVSSYQTERLSDEYIAGCLDNSIEIGYTTNEIESSQPLYQVKPNVTINTDNLLNSSTFYEWIEYHSSHNRHLTKWMDSYGLSYHQYRNHNYENVIDIRNTSNIMSFIRVFNRCTIAHEMETHALIEEIHPYHIKNADVQGDNELVVEYMLKFENIVDSILKSKHRPYQIMKESEINEIEVKLPDLNMKTQI